MRIENYLQNKLDEWGEEGSSAFIQLYSNIDNERLRKLFSKSHYEVNRLFRYLNQRLNTRHYNAVESRQLIYWIEQIDELQIKLKQSSLAFEVNDYYNRLFEVCNNFLQRSGGSPIPSSFRTVELLIIEPIFSIVSNSVILLEHEKRYELKLIGKGSYAQVFKYKDKDYNKRFVLKRAISSLDEKEKKRFKREFEVMNDLNSPYIVDVYKFDAVKMEYIMEYVDDTIGKFIEKRNNTLADNERKKIIMQVLAAFEYIHSKNLLHRDISLSNILIKCYDDTMVVKVADFGLVKIPDSKFTSVESEIKGSLNDLSDLLRCGFDQYSIVHETYALCRLISFVMTGSLKVDNIKNEKLAAFMTKGINPDTNQRYKSVSEIRSAINFI